MAAQSHPPIAKQQVVELYRKALLSGIPLEKLDTKVSTLLQRKAVSEKIEEVDEVKRSTKIKNRVPRIVRLGAALVPVFFITMGLGLVGSAVVPIAGYYLLEMPQLQAKSLTSPIPPEHVLDATALVVTQGFDPGVLLASAETEENTGPTIIDAELDFTNLSNWFTDTQLAAFSTGGSPVPAPNGAVSGSYATGQTYTIDIPSLKVSNAVVTIGGTNLNKSLIHYPGTALPGDNGAPVIFGHSVLRQFYNPSEKNPRRYNSIFSTIMTLKKGDKIYITRDNVKYTYMVQEKTEVKPEDVHILAQHYDSKQLKLVTCTPEGTYLRRGVITAVLVPG